MAKDYYEILGVSKNANQEEIKNAYRKLAHQYHPDKAGGNEAKFKEINEAYQVLGNAEKRKQYDQFGSAFENSGAQGFRWQDFSGAQGSPFGNDGVQFDFGDIGDIFGEFFNFGGRRARTRKSGPRKGNDIEAEIEIDFLEAAFGTTKEIELYKTTACVECHGNGAESGTSFRTCVTCGGSGQMETTQHTILGNIRTVVTCEKCMGDGKVAEQKCHRCGGTGYYKEKKKIEVAIPSGVDTGDSVKVASEGEAGLRGGQNGDFYVHIRLRPHPLFQREGSLIRSNIEITFPQAALGAKVAVETLDGSVTLKIPEGTQSSKEFIFKGKGVPYANRYGRGDHIVTVIVKTPTRLSRRQRQLLDEFDL
jgi:molecular chaperone DnaJ